MKKTDKEKIDTILDHDSFLSDVDVIRCQEDLNQVIRKHLYDGFQIRRCCDEFIVIFRESCNKKAIHGAITEIRQKLPAELFAHFVREIKIK